MPGGSVCENIAPTPSSTNGRPPSLTGPLCLLTGLSPSHPSQEPLFCNHAGGGRAGGPGLRSAPLEDAEPLWGGRLPPGPLLLIGKWFRGPCGGSPKCGAGIGGGGVSRDGPKRPGMNSSPSSESDSSDRPTRGERSARGGGGLGRSGGGASVSIAAIGFAATGARSDPLGAGLKENGAEKGFSASGAGASAAEENVRGVLAGSVVGGGLNPGGGLNEKGIP